MPLAFTVQRQACNSPPQNDAKKGNMSELKTVPAKNNISLRSAAIFALVGGFATGLQYALMALLIWLFDWPLVLASGVGFAISAVANYWLNSKLTFRSKERHARSLPRFAITASLGLAINSILLSFFAFLGLHAVPAQILSTLGVLIWNYTINAVWTFRNRAA
jgi:putative flippase GtrA